MKAFIRVFLVTIALVALFAQVSLSLPTGKKPAKADKPFQPAIEVVNSQPACFMQTSDGQIVNLSKLCGAQPSQPTPAIVSRPTKYDPAAIKKFDDELYGPGN